MNGWLNELHGEGRKEEPQISQMTQIRRLRNEPKRSARQFKVSGSTFKVRKFTKRSHCAFASFATSRETFLLSAKSAPSADTLIRNPLPSDGEGTIWDSCNSSLQLLRNEAIAGRAGAGNLTSANNRRKNEKKCGKRPLWPFPRRDDLLQNEK